MFWTMTIFRRLISKLSSSRFYYGCDNSTPSLFHFSTSHVNAKIVGKTSTSPVQTRSTARSRVRRAMDSDTDHHAICKKVKDGEKQRLWPRCTQFIRWHYFLNYKALRSLPQYKPYFEVAKKSRAPSYDVIRDAIKGMDIYEASNAFTQFQFENVKKPPRSALYVDLWNSSHLERPSDLTSVLINISTWVRIGIVPCNLVSEAFRLLPGSVSRETIVLCVFYRGMVSKESLPADNDIFPITEEFLLKEIASLSMFELNALCTGFFMSRRPFMNLWNGHLLMKRFFDLLPHEKYSTDFQSAMKMLAFNPWWKEGETAVEMKRLLPVLEASEFFDFCLDSESHGMHELQLLTDVLSIRLYKDEELLLKCAKTLESLLKKKAAKNFRSKDVSRVWGDLAILDVKLNDEVTKSVIDYFTNLFFPKMKVEYGVSIVEFLKASAIRGIFPYKLIDAFFSSKALMRVEKGELPGMVADTRQKSPFIDLLTYDTHVEIMCPDYNGSRVPDEIKKIAIAKYCAELDQLPIHGRAHLEDMAVQLNVFFNKKQKKNPRKYATVEQPFLSSPFLVVLNLDKKNKPIPRDQEESGLRDSRMICVYVTKKFHHLRNTDGDRLAEFKPQVRFNIECLEKLGYEVILVKHSDSSQFESKQYLDWFSQNLASQILGKKKF